MNLTVRYMTQNDCYKVDKIITPKGIMVHSTVSPGVMAAEWYDRWNKPGVRKCVHAFVDDSGVWQYLPWNMRGWHAGQHPVTKKSANDTHIGFEICEPSGFKYVDNAMVGYDPVAQEPYFRKAWNNAVELCVYLCKMFNLTEVDIICHSEGYTLGIASNHSDVMHWFPKHGESMDTFRAAVKAALALDNGNTGSEPVIGQKMTNTPGDVLIVRAAPANTAQKLGELINSSVVDVLNLNTNGWAKIKFGTLQGWVDGKYLIPVLTRILKFITPMMRGDDVKQAQARLNALGYNSGAVDGIFGPVTDTAVKRFQKDHNLVQDGDIGPITWAAMWAA